MEPTIIDKKAMETLQKLAQTNLEISNAKNALYLLKQDENAFIEEREKKTLERLEQLFRDSEDIINKTKGNYDEVSELLTTVTEFSKFVAESQGNLHNIFTLFEEREGVWQEKVAKHEAAIADVQRGIIVQQVFLSNEKKNIQKGWDDLAVERVKIKDAWGEIERELKRLKK